ncbi:hypothetical protein F8M41_016537 [Gigaspora margarita]|uniref:Uncharacterized protein n=1 Tax=Gigaspora margarita TaxID=4874 RepID=A0A8H4B338_GIGMA|nr:hypothetical protein F8M41_016537 [Gigaspora margarita]
MILPPPRLMIAPPPTIPNQNDNTSLSYNETWGKMLKENLERDRDNDDNDWINPDIEEIIDLYAEIPSFHEDYKYLLNKLPPSLINDAWKYLITRKRNSLTKIEASYINSDIESFLRHEIERYNRQKL